MTSETDYARIVNQAEAVAFPGGRPDERVICAFVRVSTPEQSTEMQRTEIERTAAFNKEHVVRWYKEVGSGGRAASSRPVFQQLTIDVKAGRVGKLYVWALDRLGRSAIEMAEMLALLVKQDVHVVSIKERVDMTTAIGRGMVMMALIFADMERERIRERIVSGLERRRAKGKPIGPARMLWTDWADRVLIECVRRGITFERIVKERLIRCQKEGDLRMRYPTSRTLRQRYDKLAKLKGLPEPVVRRQGSWLQDKQFVARQDAALAEAVATIRTWGKEPAFVARPMSGIASKMAGMHGTEDLPSEQVEDLGEESMVVEIEPDADAESSD